MRLQRLGLLVLGIIGLIFLAGWALQLELSNGWLIFLRWSVVCFGFVYAVLKRSLTTWIIYSMVVGTVLGYDFPMAEHPVLYQYIKTASKAFIHLIKTIIAPLLFGTLVVGIAGHADLKQVGRMGWKSLLYFEVVTTLALLIGLLAINFTQAGIGISMPRDAASETLPKVAAQSGPDILLHIFPENIAKSVTNGEVLQIVVFSVLFAIGLAQVPEAKRRPMIEFCESLSEAMFKFTQLVMYFAPVAVGAAIMATVGHMGLGVLQNLFALLLTLYGALVIFLLLVLLPVALIIRLDIRAFVRLISEPVSIAFATTSSEAALPKAMRAMERLGVPRRIVAFVLPTGYSFNLDGTTLYLALASIFVAQAAGQQLDWGTQLVLGLTLMLTSKGVAGVPRASLVILLGTVASFNLPEAPVYLILAIDELMDMARTSVNVIGNCLASAVIARWEGELGTPDLASDAPDD
jgi:proton glutamate symport protein